MRFNWHTEQQAYVLDSLKGVVVSCNDNGSHIILEDNTRGFATGVLLPANSEAVFSIRSIKDNGFVFLSLDSVKAA